jgi:hypothetical protein
MRYLIIALLTSFILASDLIIQYPNLKQEYYQNQIINLDIKIITPKETNLTFIPPFNSDINVTKTNQLIYNVHIKYKNDGEAKNFFIIGKNTYKQITLSNLYRSVPIAKVHGFCNVLADELNVSNIISSEYNKNKNMVSFTLNAKNANLKDFTLNLKDENLTIISDKKATYFGLLDKNITKLNFYYFNTSNGNFQKISIPINIKEQTISTQTNLNPEDSTVFTPVNILLLSLIAFLIIVFLVYQNIWLLIPPALLTALLIYTNFPKGEAYLARGTKIYILPTFNSTVFYVAPIGTKVEILKKEKHYTKIKINDKIGWVRNEDIK